MTKRKAFYNTPKAFLMQGKLHLKREQIRKTARTILLIDLIFFLFSLPSRMVHIELVRLGKALLYTEKYWVFYVEILERNDTSSLIMLVSTRHSCGGPPKFATRDL